MKTSHQSQFLFWVKYLKVISVFFSVMGIMWAVIGSFDPFGLYDYYFAQCFWNANELPSDAKRATTFLLGPFGATSAGYFILQYFIAKHAYAKKELWAYHAIVFGFSFWFILDTTMCLYHGGYFNILIANVSSLAAMLPVFFTRRYFTQS